MFMLTETGYFAPTQSHFAPTLKLFFPPKKSIHPDQKLIHPKFYNFSESFVEKVLDLNINLILLRK